MAESATMLDPAGAIALIALALSGLGGLLFSQAQSATGEHVAVGRNFRLVYRALTWLMWLGAVAGWALVLLQLSGLTTQWPDGRWMAIAFSLTAPAIGRMDSRLVTR